MSIFKKLKENSLFKSLTILSMVIFANYSYATTETLGTMASSITSTFSSVGAMITAASYIAGLGFAISAILKFKAHKDNPQQTQIGQPIGLLFVSIALLFLPSVLTSAGNTVFSGGATTAGSSGTEITGTK